MTGESRRFGAYLGGLLALLAASGCARVQGPQTGSTTNWLLACDSDSDCGELSCMCGVCNAPCVRDTSCAEINADAVCSEASPHACGQSDGQSVCALRCEADEDCGDGLTCEGGYCVDTGSAPSNVAGIPGDDAGVVDYGFGFVEIAVGGRHACGLGGVAGGRVAPGTMVCWGSDGYGQVDRERTDSLSGIAHIAAGMMHTCALLDSGTITCWGGGMLDEGQVSGVNAEAGSGFASIAAGGPTCAIRDDGSLRCWGDDGDGEVSGPNADTAADYTQVAVGSAHVCGLHQSGTLTCWGADRDGSVSGPSSAGLTDIVGVAAGDAHTCVVRATKELRCWGDERLEEVSGPNTEARPEFVQVAAGAYQTCGLRDDTSMHCWGADEDGQVTGMNSRNLAGMVQLAGSIEADGNFLCALSGDGTVNCWGNDGFGQISGLDPLARE